MEFAGSYGFCPGDFEQVAAGQTKKIRINLFPTSHIKMKTRDKFLPRCVVAILTILNTFFETQYNDF